jgi:hypothetical protein
MNGVEPKNAKEKKKRKRDFILFVLLSSLGSS